jgi:glc operon protein GlcG
MGPITIIRPRLLWQNGRVIAELTIEYAEAKRAAESMIAELERRGKAAVVVVADSHGELILLVRMDGAPRSSLAIASNKAWTAVRAGKPSKEVGERVRDAREGCDIAYYSDSRFIGFGGGIPLRKDGKVVGAVAVSGLAEMEDMEVASVGAAAIIGS